MAKRPTPPKPEQTAPAVGNTLAGAYPGAPRTDDPLSDGGVHSVTINGKTYTWKDGEEKTVPAEAVAVYKRAVEANTP